MMPILMMVSLINTGMTKVYIFFVDVEVEHTKRQFLQEVKVSSLRDAIASTCNLV